MRSGDFTQFVEDIRFNGLLEPIVVADGPILDGRNRCNACLALDIAPLLVEWDGRGTPEAFVVSKNIQRRHLDVGQRAAIAADLANMHRGNGPSQRGDRQICRSATSTSEAGRLVNVSERAVRDDRVVLRNGTPDETAAVTNGSETLNAVLRRVRDRKEPLSGGQARHTTPGIGIVADQGITADFVEQVAVICRATNEIQRLDIPRLSEKQAEEVLLDLEAAPILRQRGLLARREPILSTGDEPWDRIAKFSSGWTLRRPGTPWR